MNDLPNGWARVPLGEVGEWRGGGTPSKSNKAYWQGEIPWISPKDMKSRFIADAVDKISRAAIAGSATSLIGTGSVLLVTRSGILRHSLPTAITDCEVAINQDVKALTPWDFVLPAFIEWQLRANAQIILATCAKSGTTVDSVDFDALKQFPVWIPPLAEQRRIVAKLDALTTRTARARADLDRIPALATRYRQAILDAAFNGTRAESRRLIDLVDPKRGIPYGIVQTGDAKPAGIPTVRCGDIKHFTVTASDLKLVEPDISAAYSRTILRGGEILLAIRGSVGQSAVADHKLLGCNISREVAMIPVTATLLPRYGMYYLGSSGAQAYLKRHTKGVAQTGINLEDVRTLEVPVPDLRIQGVMVERIERAFAEIDRLTAEAASARQLLDRLDQAILAKAFRGELVPQDPGDEPASELLARIKAKRSETRVAKRGRREAAK